MKLLVCSVLDKAVSAYMQPFYCRTKPEAVRMFSDSVGDPKSQFAIHPEDFVLMVLGEYDDSTGLFACGEPERIVSAVECVARDGAAKA